MANMCWVEMELVGGKQNLIDFIRALNQEGNVWVGRGMEASYDELKEIYPGSGKYTTRVYGDTKWSINSSMIDNAISMNHQKETGEGPWAEIDKETLTEFLTLEQACKRFSVHLEAFSSEPGCEFEEHIIIKAGLMQLNDSVDMQELDIPYWRDDEGLTCEQFNEEFACDIDARIYDRADEAIKLGGYNDWGDCKEIQGIVDMIKKSYEQGSKGRDVAKEAKESAKGASGKSAGRDIEER